MVIDNKIAGSQAKQSYEKRPRLIHQKNMKIDDSVDGAYSSP
jgi:hypothetical protein